MDYCGAIYRPPSEAESLILQVTVGCSHNQCTYCDMYRDKRFSVKPDAVVDRDLDEASRMGPCFRRVFLCDGDAMVLSTARLLRIVTAIRTKLPWVQRVGIYSDPRGVLNKTVGELQELKRAGLGILYHGVESGHPEVLKRIAKGSTRADCIETAERLRQAGIVHSVIVMLGVGGVEFSAEHAHATASLLTEMDPPFVGALTTTVVPGTPLHAQVRRREWVLPDAFGMLAELEILVAQSRLSACRFSSNHASNYLPVRCELSRDRDQVLRVIRDVIARRDQHQLRPEWMRGL